MVYLFENPIFSYKNIGASPSTFIRLTMYFMFRSRNKNTASYTRGCNAYRLFRKLKEYKVTNQVYRNGQFFFFFNILSEGNKDLFIFNKFNDKIEMIINILNSL